MNDTDERLTCPGCAGRLFEIPTTISAIMTADFSRPEPISDKEIQQMQLTWDPNTTVKCKTEGCGWKGPGVEARTARSAEVMLKDLLAYLQGLTVAALPDQEHHIQLIRETTRTLRALGG